MSVFGNPLSVFKTTQDGPEASWPCPTTLLENSAAGTPVMLNA